MTAAGGGLAVPSATLNVVPTAPGDGEVSMVTDRCATRLGRNYHVAVSSEDRQPRTPIDTRIEGLDAFRGATVAAMLLVNNPGTWSAVWGLLHHATQRRKYLQGRAAELAVAQCLMPLMAEGRSRNGIDNEVDIMIVNQTSQHGWCDVMVPDLM